jgi:ParB-like chromosome segregation protein Spo0J
MIDAPKIEQRNVSELIPYAANSRTHSDAQVAQIAASIKEFGWTNPILIDGDNTIIAGHGRLLAARKLGMEEVPAIIVDHLSKAQQRALVIADNQLALNAGWDMDMLKAEIEDLNLDGFDLELLGFDDKFLDALNASKFEETRIAEEQDVEAVFEIAVSCANEDEQEKVYQILTEQGLKCRVLTM